MNTEGKENGQDGGQQDGGAPAFDVSAFSAVATPNANAGGQSSGENGQGQTQANSQGANGSDSDGATGGNDGNDDNGQFSWNAYGDDNTDSNSQGDDKEKKGSAEDGGTQGSSEDGQQQGDNKSGSDNNSGASDSDKDGDGDKGLTVQTPEFKLFAEKFGLKAETEEEFKNELDNLVAENERLKKNYPKSNEKIERYEKLTKLEDKELVKQNLLAEGFEGEDLENAIEKYIDNDLLEIEAKKIRNTLNKATAKEREKLIAEDAKESTKYEQQREEGIKELNQYLSSTDEMFGFKMAPADKLDNVRAKHQEYITSGTFLNEVTKDSKTLAEAAWLWKNREVILKAMKNQGSNEATKRVLDKIGHADPDAGTRTFLDPEGGKEFDPSAFSAREKK